MVNVKQSSAKVMDMAVGYYMSHQLIPHKALLRHPFTSTSSHLEPYLK